MNMLKRILRSLDDFDIVKSIYMYKDICDESKGRIKKRLLHLFR